ncbi:hypothetical protein Ancab_024278 [Ancistrocladus abbreviatus]
MRYWPWMNPCLFIASRPVKIEAQEGNSSDIRRPETEVESANASNTFTSNFIEDFNDVPPNQCDFDHSTIDPSVRPSKKVAEVIGFTSCIYSCLDYLEVVRWAGEEEEEKVVTSVLYLQNEVVGVNPVLKRVSSNVSKPFKSLFCKIHSYGFIGYQDALWDATGRLYFKSCYIEGAIDFIWGYAQSVYEGANEHQPEALTNLLTAAEKRGNSSVWRLHE